jgi:hypothetical protein
MAKTANINNDLGIVLFPTSNTLQIVDNATKKAYTVKLEDTSEDTAFNTADFDSILDKNQNLNVQTVTADLKGSLFADDSSIMVDGVNGVVVGPVDTKGGQARYSAMVAQLSDLDAVDPDTYHGMVIHVHSEGAWYGAHAGAWHKIADMDSSLKGDFMGSVFGNDSTVIVDGNDNTVHANYFYGDGSNLTGIAGVSQTLQVTTDFGATTTTQSTFSGGIITDAIDSSTNVTVTANALDVQGNITTSGSITAATGIVTAASFAGDGANITNVAYNNLTGAPSLGTVATSNSYDDLDDLPSIPSIGSTTGVNFRNSGSGSGAFAAGTTLLDHLNAAVELDITVTTGYTKVLFTGTVSVSTQGGQPNGTERLELLREVNGGAPVVLTELAVSQYDNPITVTHLDSHAGTPGDTITYYMRVKAGSANVYLNYDLVNTYVAQECL